MNRNFIFDHWYASVYEQFEIQTNDVEFLLSVLSGRCGGEPQRILEVACGGGRICVPLAQAGHDVMGFDADRQRLLRCYRRAAGLPNLRAYCADALTADWGSGFDVVVLGGNILINIETDMDYEVAQRTFINKAASALRVGGHLFMDFDLGYDPADFFNTLLESHYFEGVDELGTVGRTVSYGSVYDPVTQVCAGTSHVELTTNSGERMIKGGQWHKHIPTQAQVYDWLARAGLTIEETWRNYSDESLPEPITEGTHRATIWARKR